MPALTPEFLMDLETNMRHIAANEYQRLLEGGLWWDSVARTMPSVNKKERITWFLDSAKITRTNKRGGRAIFEDLVAQTTEYENENAQAGLIMKKEEVEDHDGNGIETAGEWARQMGAYAGYWPQKVLAEAIRNNPITYDGLPFFSEIGAPHPVNPFDLAAGSFANVFTGAPAGTYPGAVPIDDSVPLEEALENLNKVKAYIAAIKMPNGEDPRQLKIDAILHPPALTSRTQQLTKARFIAQAASSGGGSGDVEAVITNMGFGEPMEAAELATEFGGNDTTYYVLARTITSDQLGAFAYVDREAFAIIFHGEQTDAQLARIRDLQWTTEGRNVIGAGHPYLMFECRGS